MPDFVAGAADATAAIASAPFEVTFDRAVSFSAGRSARVVQRRRHSELIAFQRALGHSIQKRGLGRAKPQYTPHVTMLYDERAVEDHAIAPLRWTVRDFALVLSVRGQSQYNILGRWPLRDPLSRVS